MKALAPAAGSWSALLSLFEPEVHGFVSRTSGRLDGLLGVLREQPLDGRTEPDGYAGFARRGRYERLLLSEWLFAEEAPDEFLRRAASGEHAFHELARRDPRSKRTLLVLLDAGPDQIGAPRLAHVAALVSLDRRARRAGATLAWAMLGDPPRPIATEVDPVSFTGFVAAHVDRAPSPESARRTIEAASALGPFAEVWLVGAPSTAEQVSVPSARRLVVEETLDPARRALEISVASASALGRRVTIDLPEPRVAIRMLRDPFAQKALAPALVRAPSVVDATIDPRRPFYLAPSGRRMFGLAPDGSATSQPVPDVPTAKARRPYVLRCESGETVLAVGLDGKRPIALGLAGHELVLHADKRPQRAALRDSELRADFAALVDHGPAELVPLDGSLRSYLLLHPRGSFEVRRDAAWEVRPSSAIAFTHHRTGSARRTFVTQRMPGGVHVGVVLPVVGEPSSVVVDALPTPVQAFAATPQRGSLVAFREADGLFSVIRRPETGADPSREHWTRVAPLDGEVVGLLASHLGPLLVVVRGADLFVQSASSATITFKRSFDARIRYVACASANPVVAVATEDDRVTVLETVLAREMLVLGGTAR